MSNSQAPSFLDHLRPSTIYHLLISRASDDLQAPHQLSASTIDDYFQWIDTQGGKAGIKNDFLR